MANLPTGNELTGATTTNAQQKANFVALRTFIAELLGTNSADKVGARQALGIGLQSGGAVEVNAGISLTVTQHLGRTIYGQSGVNFPVNLPSAATCFAGSRIAFTNNNFGVMFVNRIGGDIIVSGVNARTEIALARGDTLTLESNGASAWTAVEGTAQMRDSGAFRSLTGQSKFQVFPSGLILQSGTAVCDSAGNVGVTFPIAFTINNPEIVLSPFVSNYVTYGLNVAARGAGGFNVQGSNNNAATGGLNFSWMAFGY